MLRPSSALDLRLINGTGSKGTRSAALNRHLISSSDAAQSFEDTGCERFSRPTCVSISRRNSERLAGSSSVQDKGGSPTSAAQQAQLPTRFAQATRPNASKPVQQTQYDKQTDGGSSPTNRVTLLPPSAGESTAAGSSQGVQQPVAESSGVGGTPKHSNQSPLSRHNSRGGFRGGLPAAKSFHDPKGTEILKQAAAKR